MSIAPVASLISNTCLTIIYIMLMFVIFLHSKFYVVVDELTIPESEFDINIAEADGLKQYLKLLGNLDCYFIIT
jgi:hypothetical protein